MPAENKRVGTGIGDTQSRDDELGHDLLIEDEAIGIHVEIRRFQSIPTIGAISGAIFGKV
jgi:hypothetical protein